MQSTVIHDPQRIDRAKYVAALKERFPELTITQAKKPTWETDPHNRALRGCILSHMEAVYQVNKNEPLLVLEDDAVIWEEGWAAWEKSKHNTPKDAGIVMLGSETEVHGPDIDGFHNVLPKFFGSHAVVYTEALLRSNWLLEAYKITAANIVGRTPTGENLCPESIMLQACNNVGLRVYRPTRMAFTAASGWSARDSAIVPARDKNMKLPTTRKVIGTLFCGLGNQMFQIAAAASLAKEQGLPWLVAPMEEYPLPQGRFPRTYKNTIFSRIPLRQQYTAPLPNLVEKEFGYQPIELPDDTGDIVMKGWWQSPKYHSHIDPKELFDLSWYLPTLINELENKFQKPLCAVHFRGGDYRDDPLRDICGVEYYRPIMEEMQKTHALVLVSDDIPLAVYRLGLSNFQHVLSQEHDFQDLAFMSKTDALIMGNSTFAWWAGALGSHSQVHAPSKWFGDSSISSIDIPRSDWFLHEVPDIITPLQF